MTGDPATDSTVDPAVVAPADSCAEWSALHPDTVKVSAILLAGAAVAAGVPTTVGVASGTSLPVALAWVLPGAFLLIAGGAVADHVRWRRTRYRVSSSVMELRQGLVFTQHRSLARERIRSVDLDANPLLRIFGLVKVTIGTGDGRQGSTGTGQQTLVLDPVDRHEGDRLREVLLDRSGGVATDDEEQRPALAQWSPGWIRFAPLSFWTFALSAAALGAIFQVAGWFGLDEAPVNVTRDLAERFGPVQTLVGGIVVFTVAGAVATLAITVEAWWGYRLERESRGTLRVRRGLLTSRSMSIEERRIRGVEIVEPFGVRMAGAARLDVVATGMSQDPTKESAVLVPAAPRSVTWSVAGDVVGVGVGNCGVALLGHPVRARARRLLRAAVVIVGVLGVMWGVMLVSTPTAFWAGVIGTTAVLVSTGAVGMALDAYRSLGHAFDGEYLVARRGSIRRASVHLERKGIIGWRIRQSIFQRRAGLLTVTATTAAGKGRYPIIDADEHEGLEFASEAVPELLEPFLTRD